VGASVFHSVVYLQVAARLEGQMGRADFTTSEIDRSLRWLYSGCAGLILAHLLVVLAALFLSGTARSVCIVVTKLWIIGSGAVLIWGIHRAAAIWSSDASAGEYVGDETEAHTVND
jgi:hypothetical protein